MAALSWRRLALMPLIATDATNYTSALDTFNKEPGPAERRPVALPPSVIQLHSPNYVKLSKCSSPATFSYTTALAPGMHSRRRIPCA